MGTHGEGDVPVVAALHIEFVRLDSPEAVVPAYQRALGRDDGVSTVLVEWGDKYAA